MYHKLLHLSLCLALFAGVAHAQQKPYTLGIGRITVNPSVIEAVAQTNDSLALRRVIEGMEAQLRSAIDDVGIFTIVERSKDAMASIQEEQGLISSGLADPTKPGTAQIGQFTGANYLIITQVNDFQDFTEKQELAGSGKTIALRTIRMGMSSWIVDTGTSEILKTANFQIDARDLQQQSQSIQTSAGTTSDKLFFTLAQDMSRHVMRDIVYKQFPPRVLARTGEMVTLQMGRGSGVKRGDKFDVFALGDDLKDPYTGKNLGPEEIFIGQVEIVRVNPDKSMAKVLEDYGIEAMQIIRPTEEEDAED